MMQYQRKYENDPIDANKVTRRIIKKNTLKYAKSIEMQQNC